MSTVLSRFLTDVYWLNNNLVLLHKWNFSANLLIGIKILKNIQPPLSFYWERNIKITITQFTNILVQEIYSLLMWQISRYYATAGYGFRRSSATVSFRTHETRKINLFLRNVEVEWILPQQRILSTVLFPKQLNCCDGIYNYKRLISEQSAGYKIVSGQPTEGEDIKGPLRGKISEGQNSA
jgi:hypothetical protein